MKIGDLKLDLDGLEKTKNGVQIEFVGLENTIKGHNVYHNVGATA